MPIPSAAVAALLLAASAPGPVPGPQTRLIIDTETTIAGQPVVVPQAPLQVVATRIGLKAGSTIGAHMHFWARYVYVESGEIELSLAGSQATRTFRAGELIVEPIGKWHSGRVVGDTVLIAIEQVPPGRCNTVRPPAAGNSNDC
ncbi:MAG TPA: cupin domain-containing protein [Allosphingosinicella sp.]|jgi:quercetin dioxygenase-like cupin family protein